MNDFFTMLLESRDLATCFLISLPQVDGFFEGYFDTASYLVVLVECRNQCNVIGLWLVDVWKSPNATLFFESILGY
jgi:hypothetical protein